MVDEKGEEEVERRNRVEAEEGHPCPYIPAYYNIHKLPTTTKKLLIPLPNVPH